MAFVNRAARTMNSSRKESNEVGPGNYFTEESIIIEKNNNAPFNSSTTRPNYYKGTDNNVGPGSYETSSSYNEILNKTKPLNTSLYKAVEASVLPPYLIKSLENAQKIGFSMKTKRFGETKLQIEGKNLPGPGQYQITSSDFEKRNIKKNKARSHNNASSTSRPSSISTIPSKEMYGYDFVDGIPVLIPNPYKGEKQDKADQYDLSPKWEKNSINWNKMSMNNPQWMIPNYTGSKNISSSYTTVSNDNLIHNRRLSHNHQTEALSRSIVFKTIMDKRNNLYHPNSIKANTIADFVFNCSPGPGYYTQDGNLHNENSPRRPKLQSFGSTSPRFATKQHNDNYQMYIDNNKPKPQRFIPKIKHLFSEEEVKEKKQTFISQSQLKEETNCNIGPGSYNLSKSLLKKKPSPIEGFGSKGNRFIEEEKTGPGPGAYINTNEENNLTKNQKLSKMISPSLSSSQPSESLQKVRSRKENPSIGFYNPSILSSINYKVLSKINQFQDNKKVAFSVQEKRFNQKGRNNSSTSPTLGPGVYLKSNLFNIDHIKASSVPFNQAAIRFNYNIKEPNNPAPGSYEISLFHDWNKKTHNILFT